jgi:hypothetical protein
MQNSGDRGDHFAAGYAAGAFCQREDRGHDGAAWMVAFRRMVVEVQAVRHRAIGKRGQ